MIDQRDKLELSILGRRGDNDFQALLRYDENLDGKLDANDAIWIELKVSLDLKQRMLNLC